MNLERGLVVVDSSGLCVCVHHAATRTHNILAQGEHEYVSLPTAPHADRQTQQQQQHIVQEERGTAQFQCSFTMHTQSVSE